MLDLTPEELEAAVGFLRHIEEQALAGYGEHGRGFLLMVRQDGMPEPLLLYTHPKDATWEAYTGEADLIEAVQTYDLAVQFVVFEALVDERQQAFTDIQISVWGYQYLEPPALSA